jgi:hypothetical protein
MPKDFYTFLGFKLKDFFNNKLNDYTVKLSEEDEVSYRKLAALALDLCSNLVKKGYYDHPIYIYIYIYIYITLRILNS